jgi:ATP-dependent exoDNAse (exonuclease V) beta subunit
MASGTLPCLFSRRPPRLLCASAQYSTLANRLNATEKPSSRPQPQRAARRQTGRSASPAPIRGQCALQPPITAAPVQAGSPPHSGRHARKKEARRSTRKSRTSRATAVHKPAQDRARLPRPIPPRQRHGQRQPHQRNVGQDAEGSSTRPCSPRQGRHGDVMHEGKPTAPARRLQKIDPEIEPEIMQTEELPRNLPLPANW